MSITTRNTPCVLIIRDGWGRNPHPQHDSFNAIKLARTPVAEGLESQWPTALIRTSGEDVGLPVTAAGAVMGNSEVGHQNIGAGRIVDQELMRITRAIRSGAFFEAPQLTAAFIRAKASGRALHLMGLVSNGQVHSDLDHLWALIKMAERLGFPADRLFVHAFTDGRDTPTRAGLGFIEEVETHLSGRGRIATVMGRFWAMDRDYRWDRVKRAYDCLTGVGSSLASNSAADALRFAYDNPIDENRKGDEFVQPTRILADEGVLQSGDSVVFFNFRGDRPRELVKSLLYEDAPFAALKGGGFARTWRPQDLYFCTMSDYEHGLPVHVAFARPPKMPDILGDWLAQKSLRQLRCAETEKFPHVTFFFNDYREPPFEGEVRTLIQSPQDVATYDLKPQMSAAGVRDAVIARLHTEDCEDVIIVNFANGDMVGHTGNLRAAIAACECVDGCVGAIVEATLTRGGSLIVTADHGNAEQMKDPLTGAPHTAHTNYPVPLTVVGAEFRSKRLREDGRLADIAPTLLAMMGLSKPAAMSGSTLICD
ncbi:MAG: 2,3-bisphosphoglycerate-independent phosphoglycerate mutase [Phycisphaerales bacterium]|nr:2,3-bisphosphoglycerate-independent phosphoglycerate mutase [Phycisphaerales bacterium]